MRNFFHMASRSAYIPSLERFGGAVRAFSASGRALFFFFAGMCLISSISLLYILNETLLVPTPASGGEFNEGIIGSPRFINPVLAVSDADRDLITLMYSGLLRATPEGGYEPDLAESYEISPDGTAYTFTLRDDASFHNGTPVNSDDVIFTIAKIQDPAIKSPLRANWEGVAVEKVDQKTVRMTLKSAYAPFIENATLGILPQTLWQSVSNEEFSFSDLNTSPVGSGPFRLATIVRTPSGIPSMYELRPFLSYTGGRPYLSAIKLHFYQSEQALLDALKGGDIEAASGISPASLSQIPDLPVRQAPLNRVFGVFFNQNQSSVLRDRTVRAALDRAIDRDTLIDEALSGYATALSGPLPQAAPEDNRDRNTHIEEARTMLANAGWENKDGVLTKTSGSGKDAQTLELALTLSTSDVPELRAVAEELRQVWSAVGARVDVQIFEQGDLSQNVIRPRKYDALLFGEIIGREPDLYAFWHSSQRNDPGLNIALYANATADSLLEEMRTTTDGTKRAELFEELKTELQTDIPALFLYAPDFVYSIPNDIQGFSLGSIETPSDRYLSAASWHRNTDYVWPLFATPIN